MTAENDAADENLVQQQIELTFMADYHFLLSNRLKTSVFTHYIHEYISDFIIYLYFEWCVFNKMLDGTERKISRWRMVQFYCSYEM